MLTIEAGRVDDSRPYLEETALIPLASLKPARYYPRLGGIDQDHLQVLADSSTPMPPILVQRSMHIIDGTHRVCAARLRGESHILAIVVDENDTEAYIRSLSANIRHGLPLTLSDRKAAAERLLRICPERSDRALAELVGLSGKTVGALRRSIEDLPPAMSRVGRDGRVRPVDATENRRVALQLIAERPGASLREVALAAGVSASTVGAARRKSQPADVTAVSEKRRLEPAELIGPDPDPKQTLSNLMRDPSLRYTDVGRTLLRWLNRHPVGDEQSWQELVAAVPSHCLPAVVKLSRRFAGDWRELARYAEDLMGSEAAA